MDGANNEKIVGYFIEEAQEHLETLEKGILELSSAVNDEETVNELFRAAHSVKGGAAMLGFNSISKSAHRLEDAFKILRDHTIPIDQNLEGLFLRGYDTLQDLLERLQGPFGLPEDEGEEIMKEAEPHFQELLDYLQKLVNGETPATPSFAQEKPSSTQSITRDTLTSRPVTSDNLVNQVKRILKQMLSIFKQEPNPENRRELQNLCDNLGDLATNERGWQSLIDVSKKAIDNPQHSYKLLAPVIIKEIKLAGDCLAVGKGSEVAPSQGLENLSEAKIPQILLSLEPEMAAHTLIKVFNKEKLSKLLKILQTAN